MFISVEDETRVANAVVPPGLFETARLTITQENFLRITGPVQSKQGLPMVRAARVERRFIPLFAGLASHDFH